MDMLFLVLLLLLTQVPMSKVNWDARMDSEYITNYKVRFGLIRHAGGFGCHEWKVKVDRHLDARGFGEKGDSIPRC